MRRVCGVDTTALWCYPDGKQKHRLISTPESEWVSCVRSEWHLGTTTTTAAATTTTTTVRYPHSFMWWWYKKKIVWYLYSLVLECSPRGVLFSCPRTAPQSESWQRSWLVVRLLLLLRRPEGMFLCTCGVVDCNSSMRSESCHYGIACPALARSFALLVVLVQQYGIHTRSSCSVTLKLCFCAHPFVVFVGVTV